MADTIVNTPSSNDSGAGWAVAIIILLVVIVGGFLWFRTRGVPAAPAQPGANINVTIPTPSAGGSAGTGANTTQ